MWAMVRWSDNAAADYLLALIGADHVVALGHARDLLTDDAIGSVFGETLGWSYVAIGDWETMTPERRVELGFRLARQKRGPIRGLDLPPVAIQRRFAATTTAGTARQWAHYMGSIATGDGLDREAAVIMRAHLEWPLHAFAENAQMFKSFGTKGGSLAGVVTEVSYLHPVDGELTAVAMFFDDVAVEEWTQLTRTLVHQELLLQLATRAEVLERLETALPEQPPG